MKVSVLIKAFMVMSLCSCSISNKKFIGSDKQEYIIDEQDTFLLVQEIPEEIIDTSSTVKRNDEMDIKCFYEYVDYDKSLYNECSMDNRLYVTFNLFFDSIANDTIIVKRIEIHEIRDLNRKVVVRKDCEDYFLLQLYRKTYVYKCNNIKAVRLECVALKPNN